MAKTASKGRKGDMLCTVPHQSGLLLVQKEFTKGKNNILSRILSFNFDYIYKWHVFQLHICTRTELRGKYGFPRNKTAK
jgi:hypothetical protein